MTATNNRPVRATTYGSGTSKLRNALANLQPFTTSGALRGETWKRDTVTTWDLGRLNRDEANRFMIDHVAGIQYVVYSYSTPIGWVRTDGEVYVVGQRFSVTTGRHRSFLYLLNRPELAW